MCIFTQFLCRLFPPWLAPSIEWVVNSPPSLGGSLSDCFAWMVGKMQDIGRTGARSGSADQMGT